ncbi:hypothetical protein AMAG_05887 [Allomyces macrogynus ATCC 38327]|uniref:Uncharacterized protein n=1 Tax=Allomyces macrogynus (strain ATCC 38327) TaxID=578462 RepID=A0A0L0SDA1_ALLM3|nr:hypothetical protein AMAG_05887 [Allomyces macrogynus ATCC 38327]|eukprot:KNE60503.1 hypothetical protein AMAG_05887 [Allomyces macrogynus ATCC 38327]
MMASTDGTAGTPPPKYRFLVHRIVNKLPVPLALTGDMHASGRWWTTPPLDVAPHSDADYSSCNSDTALQVLPGTSGAVTYKVENTDLVVALFFSNPTIGTVLSMVTGKNMHARVDVAAMGGVAADAEGRPAKSRRRLSLSRARALHSRVASVGARVLPLASPHSSPSSSLVH